MYISNVKPWTLLRRRRNHYLRQFPETRGWEGRNINITAYPDVCLVNETSNLDLTKVQNGPEQFRTPSSPYVGEPFFFRRDSFWVIKGIYKSLPSLWSHGSVMDSLLCSAAHPHHSWLVWTWETGGRKSDPKFFSDLTSLKPTGMSFAFLERWEHWVFSCAMFTHCAAKEAPALPYIYYAISWLIAQ